MPRPYTLHTLGRGLAALEALAAADGALTLTELSRRLRASRTVVFRVLRTLQVRGWVEQDPGSKRYRLGLRTWEVGSRAVRGHALLDVAQPALRWLAQVTGETAILAVLRGTDVLYLDVVHSPAPLRVCVEPGARAPAYATASGKAMLAHDPDAERAAMRRPMPALTAHTLTHPTQLRRRLAEIRRTGFSLSRGERREDVAALAAPVFDAGGRCVAALSLAGPSTRLTGDHLEEMKRHLRKAAEDVSLRLGHVPRSRTRFDPERRTPSWR